MWGGGCRPRLRRTRRARRQSGSSARGGKEEERRAEAEELSAEVEEPLFLSTPAFMVSVGEE
jgi:hypothetical protein